MSKKGYLVSLTTVLVASLILSLIAGCSQTPAPPPVEKEAKVAPTMVVTPAVVELDAGAKVIIMGSNFEPGQKIHVIVVGDVPEATYEVTFVSEPTPAPDASGNWITAWTLKEYTRVLGNWSPTKGEGIYNIQATDADFNVLAQAPLGIAIIKDKPEKEWAAWAQVLLKKK